MFTLLLRAVDHSQLLSGKSELLQPASRIFRDFNLFYNCKFLNRVSLLVFSSRPLIVRLFFTWICHPFLEEIPRSKVFGAIGIPGKIITTFQNPVELTGFFTWGLCFLIFSDIFVSTLLFSGDLNILLRKSNSSLVFSTGSIGMNSSNFSRFLTSSLYVPYLGSMSTVAMLLIRKKGLCTV